jgi:hypothetical protein
LTERLMTTSLLVKVLGEHIEKAIRQASTAAT